MIPAQVSALLLCSCAAVAAFAQTPASQSTPAAPVAAQPAAVSPAQPLPTDPAALLQLVAQVNGLHGSDLKPWHMHATWQKLDNHGHVKDQGTYEEWWAAPDEFKIELTGSHFHQTRWVTSNGDYSAGDPGFPPWAFAQISSNITFPASIEATPGLPLQMFQEKQHGDPLDCLGLSAEVKGTPLLDKICFADGLPAVRIAANRASQTILNSLVEFQGKYVARDIEIHPSDMPTIHVSLDRVEDLQPVVPTEFQPPSSAAPATPWAHGVPGLVPGRLISGNAPEYTNDLRMRHVEGSVLLSVQIDKDGIVRDVEPVAGPIALQEMAIETVKSWHYSPWRLNGVPVPAQTDVTITMGLGATKVL
jgi:TonB family protein